MRYEEAATRFRPACERVQARIEGAYGIPVFTWDIRDPLTGDLNGAEIHIDYLLDAEQRLFLLAHLFGHTVQWNVNPKAYELGQLRAVPVPTEILPALLAYEREAAGYALTLLDESEAGEFAQWFADYSACDLAYLEHFYTSGEKRPFESFWREGAAMLEALPIPKFTPQVRQRRLDGLVI